MEPLYSWVSKDPRATWTLDYRWVQVDSSSVVIVLVLPAMLVYQERTMVSNLEIAAEVEDEVEVGVGVGVGVEVEVELANLELV